ncbi:response regulator, partial [candidate division KSB1 bacterium]
ARGGKYNPEPININDLIVETMKVSEKIFEKNIKVSFEFTQNIHTVEADRNQLEQVFTNLIINAKDAMPSGGTITFRTENMTVDENFESAFGDFNKGNYVKITVSDTGIGMNKAVSSRIFEPFFTTKGEGKGTGLGLATVYGIIKNHGGYISAESEVNKGTAFSIFLQASEKKVSEKEVFPEQNLSGEGIILVADDEQSLRELIKEQLEELGYSVLLAEDGIDAVNVYKKHKDDIDLVLLDIIMPRMAGKETFLELKKINNDVKVLIISGYSQDEKTAEILKKGGLGFLQKPFKLRDLSSIVAKSIGNKG